MASRRSTILSTRGVSSREVTTFLRKEEGVLDEGEGGLEEEHNLENGDPDEERARRLARGEARR